MINVFLIPSFLKIFNGIDLTSGHCPSKPNLFATQRLSVLFKNEEMETMTLDPSPKSGKGTLDPERISILFGELKFATV